MPEPQEPTVWDFVKALLMPWRGKIPAIPHQEQIQDDEKSTPVQVDEVPIPEIRSGRPPILSITALSIALFAQASLQPVLGSERSWHLGVIFYCLATLSLTAAIWRGEWQLSHHKPDIKFQDPGTFHGGLLVIGMILSAIAFFLLKGNLFTKSNVFFWLGSILATLAALWLFKGSLNWRKWLQQSKTFFKQTPWQVRINISRWTLVCLLVFGLIVFFRFYRLTSVPPEMTSDHAEKLLDVWDVLNGAPHIYFVRNSGREPFQFYLTATVAKLFDTGYSFLSLKLGTSLMGLIFVAYMYALGKEVGNRRVGLFAMLFSGIGFWPNMITRVALRFSLLPLFTAPVMFHLFRGLRTRNRNHFLLAGLFLGIGLHGYSPYRIVPVLVLVATGLYLLHSQSRGGRQQTLNGLALLIIISFLVFLPIIRFIIDPSLTDNEIFFTRMLTRVSSAEQPIPGEPLMIFLDNIRRALVMFFWDGGTIWTVSLPGYPSLNIVSAALYFLGSIALLIRYFQKRHWMDITLLVSIPILLLSSALAIAFPTENPAMNRASGALVPAFVIAALALDGTMTAIGKWQQRVTGRRLAWGLALIIIFLCAGQDYSFVFDRYQANYLASSWNTSEIGTLIHDFAESIGSYDTAWVIPYPHWVDTRLVGMNAGQPTRDYAIQREDLATTGDVPGYRLFIINMQDTETLQQLQVLYPSGYWSPYHTAPIDLPGKNFFVFIVPGNPSASINSHP